MSVKVTRSEGAPGHTASMIDFLSGVQAPAPIKEQIKRDVGDFLLETILQTVRKAESPVSGESWPVLDKEYKTHKREEGSTPEANMELHGTMLDSLTYRETPDGIELGFFDEEAWKADGHLKFSGKENNTPKRRFIPAEGQRFKAEIEAGIEQIIADAMGDAAPVTPEDLRGVSSKAELYDQLQRFFPNLSTPLIKSTILRTPELVALLDELDLLDLL